MQFSTVMAFALLPSSVWGGIRVTTFTHQSEISHAAVCQNDKLIVIGKDESISVWDTKNNKMAYRGQMRSDWVNTCFSAFVTTNGKTVGYATKKNEISLFDMAAGKTVRTIALNQTICSFVPSHDQRYLAVEVVDHHYGHAVQLLDFNTGHQIRAFGVLQMAGVFMNATPGRLAFSPDGKLLAASSWSNVVHVWDIASGKELHRFKGRDAGILSVAFSIDGSHLLTRSCGRDMHGVLEDNTANVWSLALDRVITTIHQTEFPLSFAAFSPDGVLIVMPGGADGVQFADVFGGNKVATFRGETEGFALSSEANDL